MAYDPIVLGSNITGNYGALPSDLNYYISPDQDPKEVMVENADGTYTIPTYTREMNDTSGVDWSMYGTKYTKMVDFFKNVKTGEFIYDPKDDQISEEEANASATEFKEEFGIDPKELIKQEAIALGGQLVAGVGGQLGRAAAAAGNLTEGASNLYNKFKPMDVFRAPADGPGAKIQFSPLSDNAKLADLDKKINLKPATQTDLALQNEAKAEKAELLANASAADTNILSGFQDRSGFKTVDGKMSAAGKANIGGSLGAGVATIAYNLATGKNLKESVTAGAKVGVGTYVGGLFGPIGGMIGGLIGGRVICNELMRQGLLTRKEVLLDYRFTRDYLTPTHVNGYHVWAVWMVKQMRQGRFVPFWKHVAGHRANEIAHIYGERDKPDYLGKVYRKVLEPICWSIGFFCKTTDWSVLYKQKEI